jgi:hypothetical protein
METKIIVIDDFYDQPDLVVDYALSLQFEKQESSTYPGKNSVSGLWHDALKDRIASIVVNDICPSPNMSNGLFRLSAANDTFEQNIHVDPGSDWAGVLYLNREHPHNIDGTCFWQHNHYGFEECPKDAATASVYGFDSYDQIRENIILRDGLDRSLWKCTHRVPYKYNRLVLFRPWLFHSHGENFGSWENDKGSQRLIQLFFLREKGGFHGFPENTNVAESLGNIHGDSSTAGNEATPTSLNQALQMFKKHQEDPFNKMKKRHPALDSSMNIVDVKTIIPRFWLPNFREYSAYYEKTYGMPSATN